MLGDFPARDHYVIIDDDDVDALFCSHYNKLINILK